MLGNGSVQQPDMLALHRARRAERYQSDDGRSFRPGPGATVQAGSCRVHHRASAAALRRPNGERPTSVGGPVLQPPSPQQAPVNKRTTMPSRTCAPMILASRMSSGRYIRPSVGPARPSPSSFELLRSPWRHRLALSTWSTNMRMTRLLYLERMTASASLLVYKTIIFSASSWFPDIMVPHHCQPM